MRRLFLSALSVLGTLAAVTFASEARAGKCDSFAVDHKVSFGWLFPDPDCPVTLYGEVVVAAGGFNDEYRQDQASLRFMVENGVTLELPNATDWDIGPVFEFAVRGDTGGDGVHYELGALAHARYWFASDWLTFDMTAGPTLGQSGEFWHPGVYTRVGPTLLGAFGIHLSYDYLFGTNDHRILAGVDMTYAVAGIVACGAALGMAKASNAKCW